MWGRCHDEGVTDEEYTQKSVSFSRINELRQSRMEGVCKNR